VSAMALSVLVALIFTPALCATMLKPHAHPNAPRKSILGRLGNGFSTGFEKYFARVVAFYSRIVRAVTAGPLRMLVVYGLIVAGLIALYQKTPSPFLPDEDQGALLTLVQLPSGATAEQTTDVLAKVENYFIAAEEKNVESVFSVLGFSFSSQGQNMAMMFVKLKDWGLRTNPEDSVGAIAGRAFGPLMGGIKEAIVIPIVPPAVMELGTSNGFSANLQAAAGQSHEELLAARNMLLGLAMEDPRLTAVRSSGVEDAAQFRLNIDWAKAGAVGVTAADVGNFLRTVWSSAYVNDFLYE